MSQRCKLVVNYTTGNKLFYQNEVHDVQAIRYIKKKCNCGADIKAFEVIVDGKSYFLPADTVAVETLDEPDPKALFDYLIDHRGDTPFVKDFNPYRIQNDQAAVQERVDNIPM